MEQKVQSVVVKRKKKYLGCSLLEHFELGQKVGIGTFGEVLKAKHLGNGKVVALKKIFTKSEQEGFPITSLREIKLLKNVSHPNVASLIDMAVSYKSSSQNDLKDIEDIYMVFPFMDHDLTGLLENSSIKFNLPQIKCYMKQLLEGIAYLHTRQIMHRDLKGANLLVNNKGELKITDFGLARPIEENRIKYTPGVVTRWYRPPELLFGSDIYNESIDIWGAGCIIAEMYLRKPLFGASSDVDQLKLVSHYCGTATEETYPGVTELPDYSKVQLKMEKRSLREYLETKKLDDPVIDLVDRMLVMDPKQRITAREAIEHEYFKTDPLPCLPSEIDKFESSHVYTVESREREKERAAGEIESKRMKIENYKDYNYQNYNRRRDYDDNYHRGNHPRHYDSRSFNRGNYDKLRYSYSDQMLPPSSDLPLPPPPPPPPEKESNSNSSLRDRHATNYRENSRRHDDYRRQQGRDDLEGRRVYKDKEEGHDNYSNNNYNNNTGNNNTGNNNTGYNNTGNTGKYTGNNNDDHRLYREDTPPRRIVEETNKSKSDRSRRAISYEDIEY